MKANLDSIPSERKRFFILTPGRSGSSVLSRILADSGAKFLTNKQDSSTDPFSLYESLYLNKTAYLFEQGYRLQFKYRFSIIYSVFYHKIITLLRFIARKRLNKYLKAAAYCKNTAHLHHGVRVAAHLGFWPVVILNYRNYQTWMGSLYPGLRYQTVDSLTENYVSSMKNGIASLGLFGGCAISYEEIMDLGATEWAHALGETTGLAADVILANRERLFREPGPETALPVTDVEAEHLEGMARGFEGRVVPSSRVAHQYWGNNPSKGNRAVKQSSLK